MAGERSRRAVADWQSGSCGVHLADRALLRTAHEGHDNSDVGVAKSGPAEEKGEALYLQGKTGRLVRRQR